MRSPTVLTFAGDGSRAIRGVPARDLSEHDLEREVYKRTVGKRAPETSRGLQPHEKGFAAERKSIFDGLVASGLYRAVGSAEKAGGAPHPKPAKPSAAAESSPDEGDKPPEA